MPYQQVRGRRPFERASKIAHTEIIKNPLVQQFVQNCELPEPPAASTIGDLVESVSAVPSDLKVVIAIDGGINETWVRDEYPSASVAFITLGPLLLYLEDLDELEKLPFLGPEDMQRLKKIERYSLVLPTRTVRVKGACTFSEGVRLAVQGFFLQGDGHLMTALQWLLFNGWRQDDFRETWLVPRCPNSDCGATEFEFRHDGPTEQKCYSCGRPVFLSDGLRLYERIDDNLGAGSILGFLLTALEQIVLVDVIRSIWNMKPSLLREVLFIKDGPLAFFGVTAPLYRPMRRLMTFLAEENDNLINLVGLEKSGPFVEHAALIEDQIKPGHALVLGSDYIYRYIVPGDPATKEYGKNTYYGSKVVYRGNHNDTYVATIPTSDYKVEPKLSDLINGPAVLEVTARLRCSMYDNALVPVVLANRLVSLADVPSGEILKKFAKNRLDVSS
jgi:hypothetical protein